MIKDKIKEIEIENEKIYLLKGKLGWTVVNPVKIEGKFNLKNLWIGNRKVIIFTVIWLLIMGSIIYGANEMIGSCKDMAKNPCKYTNLDCSNRLTNYYTSNFTIGGDKNVP